MQIYVFKDNEIDLSVRETINRVHVETCKKDFQLRISCLVFYGRYRWFLVLGKKYVFKKNGASF